MHIMPSKKGHGHKASSLAAVATGARDRAKGVGRVAIDGHTHQDYLDCVNGDRPQQRASCARIGVKDHVLYSFITNKISLCSFDDKS